MKLLYTVIILGLMQLAACNANNQTSIKDQLKEFYIEELKSLSREFCEKVKVLSRGILQDARVQQASSTALKEFKQKITDFLHDYPSYKRYGLITELVLLFEDAIPEPSSNPGVQYIWELLTRLGYDDINYDYEVKYETFVKDKFLAKFEQLKAQLTDNELKQQEALLNWYNELKECEDYGCQAKYFNTLIALDSSPIEQLHEYVREQLDYIHIFYGNSAYSINGNVLKDPLMSQLSPDIRQHLRIDIDEYNMRFEYNQDIGELLNLIKFFYEHILHKYYYSTALAANDRKLIVQIFNENGFTKFLSNYRTKFNDFLELGLFERFEEFRNELSSEELAKEKSLIQCFQQLKSLTIYADRHDEFAKCYALLQKRVKEGIKSGV